MSDEDRPVVVIVGSPPDLTGRITRLLAEADVAVATLDHVDLLPKAVPARLDRDIIDLKAAVACCEPLIERHRPERDWKQRERQRPGRRKRR